MYHIFLLFPLSKLLQPGETLTLVFVNKRSDVSAIFSIDVFKRSQFSEN